MESRKESPCAMGKTGRTSLQIEIFTGRFYELNLVSPHI